MRTPPPDTPESSGSQAPAATPDGGDGADANALATGLAHELANALQAIAGWAQLARQGSRIDEALEVIEQSALHSAAIARHALAELTGRPTEGGVAGHVDVGEILRQVARLLAPTAQQAQVDISVEAEPRQCIAGVRHMLWTACWNLALNAVQAMAPAGGQLRLRARRVRDADGLTPRMHVEIIDDGPGMDPELQVRALTAHYTTKAQGHGVGLALVQRAVRQLRGHLTLDSAPGEGTRWLLDFPVPAGVDHGAASDRPSASEPPAASGVFTMDPGLTARVLVVDDDPATRELVTTALGMRGAEVIAASDLQQALSTTGPFDLVIIDMVLGDGSGDAVLAQLRRTGRARQALMISGLERPPRVAPGGEPQAWLRKPFQLDELFEQVEVLLSPAPGRSVAAP